MPVGDDLQDIDAEARSITEPRTSQRGGSNRHSGGLPEFRLVQQNTRVRRKDMQKQREHVTSRAPEDIFDDLSGDLTYPHFPSTNGDYKVSRTTGTSVKRPLVGGDGADDEILKRPQGLRDEQRNFKRQKTLQHHVDDDIDELADPMPTRRPTTSSSSASVSRRGDINPAEFSLQHRPGFEPVPVKAAICTPCYLYCAKGEEDNDKIGDALCFLIYIESELRAFDIHNREAAQYPWLKITPRLKSVHFARNSNLVKIIQATEPGSTIGGIGAMMMIKFSNPDHAIQVVEWVRDYIHGAQLLEKDRYV
jgi:hypothetical protein